MSGNLSFWLGLALAFPIGIGVNLLTPVIARQLAKYNARVRRKVARAKEDEALVVDWLSENREALIFFEVRFREGAVIRGMSLVVIMLIGVLLSSVAGKIVAGYLLLLVGLTLALYETRTSGRYHRIRRPVMQRIGWPNSPYISVRAAADELRGIVEARSPATGKADASS